MADQRLKRLIEDELGECCAEDVADRKRELGTLADAIADDRETRDLRTLSALASETRYRLVRLLAAADGDLCVCELESVVDVSDSAVSHALADLTDAGLVTRRKEGKWRYYETTQRAEAVLDALTATEGDA
jgi:DNA-binding transcriptional ArsR family regulator